MSVPVSTRPVPAGSRRPALVLSFAFCYIALAGILTAAALLWHFLPLYIDFRHPGGLMPQMPGYGTILFTLYACLLVAALAVICLLRLLLYVRNGRVFTSVSVSLVTYIACLVMVEGGLFAVVGLAFPVAFGITFVAVTIGLCLLVVRGILKDAILLKEENDQTI